MIFYLVISGYIEACNYFKYLSTFNCVNLNRNSSQRNVLCFTYDCTNAKQIHRKTIVQGSTNTTLARAGADNQRQHLIARP